MYKAALLVLIVPFLVGCNMQVPKDRPVPEQMDQESQPQEALNQGLEVDDLSLTAEAFGVIEGPLLFPSEVIPESMKVCAEPVENGEEICTDEHIEDDKYQNGVGFSLEVPAGEYYVYAFLPENPKQKAYYNEFVTCGLKYECTSREKIVVAVEAGETVSDIKPHDWYDTQP